MTTSTRSWQLRPAPDWIFERPATTIAGDPRLWPPGHKINSDDRRRVADADDRYRGRGANSGAIRLTLAQALVLQGFRADYPIRGNRTSAFGQVGDAIPPPLAEHVLRAAIGA